MQFVVTWIWSMIPVWINVQALLAKGDYWWLPVAVLSGVAAPFGLWLSGGIRSRPWRLVAALGGILASIYNITNAIGSSAEHQQTGAAPNYERIQHRESLLRRDALLADKIGKIGWRLNGDTSFSIKAGIEQIKTTPHYIGTDGCRDLKRRDPGQVCFKLTGEEGRLNEATQVEAFEIEREQIRQDLLKVEGPATADVRITTLRTLLSYVWDVKEPTVIAILAGIWAVIWELVGTLIPPAAGRYFAERNESRTGAGGATHLPPCPEVAPKVPVIVSNSLVVAAGHPPPSPPPACPQDGFRTYYGATLEADGATHLPTRPLYHNYRAWADRQKLPTVDETTFGRLMAEAGYAKGKRNRGQRCYIGVRMKQQELRVVK